MMNKLATNTLILLLASGCASQPKYFTEVPETKLNEFLSGKPSAAKPHFKSLIEEGKRNQVLNEMRTSLIAFELGDLELARTGLDSVLDSVETIYADNDSAKKARSKFRAEKTKEFKGEGYERAMAFYYRGLLYLAEEDYENARASFLSAQLQDSFAEQQEYSADFASMDWLAGWASHCQALSNQFDNVSAGQADQYFRAAAKLNSSIGSPSLLDNILVIAESGTSPQKVNSAKGTEFLSYIRGKTVRPPTLQWAGDVIPVRNAEDIFWQASTRGGRQVDVVNSQKAAFKQSAADTAVAAASVADAGLSVAGTLLETQALLGYSEDLMNATGVAALGGLFGSVVSGASSKISDATKPEADIRYWDNLPDKLHFAYFSADQMPETIQGISFTGKNQGIDILGGNKACGLGWVRTHSALEVPPIHINAR